MATMVNLPKAYSNKGKVEQARADAAAAFTRMMLRAVAETNTNFTIYSAYRSKAKQTELFLANYVRVSRGRKYESDRAYAGSIWAMKDGGVRVASPDIPPTGQGADHRTGIGFDTYPTQIQSWMRTNAPRFGFTHTVGYQKEPWHVGYRGSVDQYKSEGVPDIVGMQKKLGLEADGKPGKDFVAAVKKFQKANGLTVDGIAGPRTQKAILAGKGEAAPVADKPASSDLAIAALPAIETNLTSANVNRERFGESIKHITIHWWGTPVGQSFESIRDYLVKDRGDSGTSAHYICEAGRVARIVPEDWTAWANGNRTANRQGISIECNPNDVVGTLPTLAALVKDIRNRYGDLPIYPHQHWTATECPGDYVQHLDELDTLARTGKVSAPATAKPATPTPATPSRKATFMDLVKAPDFPLLRTAEHKCFYGDSKKLEAVSGKMPNSLAPGDIFGTGASSGSRGLKSWQKAVGLKADGRYGDATKAKAKTIQKAHGLTVDGAIGPDTWYAGHIYKGK